MTTQPQPEPILRDLANKLDQLTADVDQRFDALSDVGFIRASNAPSLSIKTFAVVMHGDKMSDDPIANKIDAANAPDRSTG